MAEHETDYSPEDDFIAVVGMAGRYPEAPDLDAFWDNIRKGRDCLHTFTEDELDELGIPRSRYRAHNFVPRGTRLPDHDRFDASFFGFTPRQAEIMDPQSRIFLETCYTALEAAGYDPFDTGHSVGVFGGSNPCDYASLVGVADPSDSLDAFDQLIGLDRDFLTTRVSHHLGLNGPSMTVQTACSTSLVAIHTAVQSLLAFECSMALAGGVTVNFRQGVGYFHQQGMILSPTGECRAFDADASGTTLGQGCGVVALKRLDDAIADGDRIMAVVRGSAVNNDAGAKMTYTAPSEDGQTAVIAAAQAVADVEPDTIGYVETHGTGTMLGDPVEIAALTRAFRAGTDRRQYCAVGSVKTNVGHTDAASGVTGFIKTVLALYHRELPPSIHFSKPNPGIDFASSPFYVNTELSPWDAGPAPRRAGVSAFGIGGTNAHVILEEAPPIESVPTKQTAGANRLLTVSGKTESAADKRLSDLATALDTIDEPEITLDDVSYTLRVGRPKLPHRRAIVVSEGLSASDLIAGRSDRRVVRGSVISGSPQLVWTFSGQGSQHVGMGGDLYRSEAVYRDAVDATAEFFEKPLGLDIREVLRGDGDKEGHRLKQTALTQPALFTVQRALSALLRSWDLSPDIVIGHSIGEYAAAVEAGIMAWEDAAGLVAERGRQMQMMRPGAMLSVGLDPEDLNDILGDGVGLAAHNGPQQSVISGHTERIEEIADRLNREGVTTHLLRTSHAFHSTMMEDAAAGFKAAVVGTTLHKPNIPLISNVTGKAITDSEATDPRFWADQILRPVRFADCVEAVVEAGPAAFLELGPGQTLTTLARSSAGPAGSAAVAATMRRQSSDRDDHTVLLEAIGQLWAAGIDIDTARFDTPEPSRSPRRVCLPTYPFDRVELWRPENRHVLALPTLGSPETVSKGPEPDREPIDRWLYVPSWQRDPMPDAGFNEHDDSDKTGETANLLLVPDGQGGDALVEELRAAGGRWLVARPGGNVERNNDDFRVNPGDDGSLTELFTLLAEEGILVTRIVHALLADPDHSETTNGTDGEGGSLDHLLDNGIHTALACARALGTASRTTPVHLDTVTVGACSVTGQETIRPAAAALLGPTRVIPLEYSRVTTRLIDITTGLASADDRRAVAAHLATPEPKDVPDAVVAVRHGRRWTPTVVQHPAADVPGRSPLRTGGTYLIIGGLGGVGLSLARYLAEEHQASLVLTSRSGRPVAPADGTAPDAETSGRLLLIDRIAAAATSLEFAAVDATDLEAMTDLIEQTVSRSGRIDGVIVTAGQADQEGAIHRRDRASTTRSIAAKVQGLMVLERALAGHDPDFVLLSSSVASTLYHNRFAQVGYVIGNSFAEAFATRGRQRGLRTITVAWDDWTEIGMSVRAAQSFAEDYGAEVDLVDRLHSFTPEEGVALFRRALQADEPVVIVSTTDLANRIAADVDVVSPFLKQATVDDESEDATTVDGSLTDVVLATWKNILGYDQIDLHADFFELGGDSLQAARMTTRLSRALGVEVDVDLIFDSSQAAALIAALEPIVENANSRTESSGPIGGARGPVPVAPNQQRFMLRDNPNPNHFNTAVLLQTRATIATDDLRAASASLVARHDALRIRFAPDDQALSGQVWTQRVLPAEEISDPVTVIDLSASSADRATEQLIGESTDAHKTLDLIDGPVFRIVLFQLPNDQQRVLILAHHLISDRVSLLLLMDELSDGLTARVEGRSAQTDSNISVLDWAEALRDGAADETTETEVMRWLDKPLERLRPLPVASLFDPQDNRNDNVGVARIEITADQIPSMVGTDLRLDEVMLAALCSALGRWNESELAHVDVLGFGRRLPIGIDVSRSVGMFITYSPILIDVSEAADPADIVSSIREDLAQSWRLDSARLDGPSELQQSLTSLPSPQVLFNFVGKAVAADADGLLTDAPEPSGQPTDHNGRRDHLIAVRGDVADDGSVALVFVYCRAAHDASTIELLAEQTRDTIVSFGTVQ